MHIIKALTNNTFRKRGLSLTTSKTKIFFYLGCRYITEYWEHIDDNSQLNFLELSKTVTTLLVLLHGLRISTIATSDINLITMSNNTCIFYPSELLKHGRQGRPRDKIIYKKFGNSKLCPMAATNEYLERRAEYNITHKKFLFTTVSPYGPPHKG